MVILATAYLIVKTPKKGVQNALYETSNDVYLEKYNSLVNETIIIDKKDTFMLALFLNNEKVYDNLKIVLLDKNNKEVFNTVIDKYQSNAMFLGFVPIEKNDIYTLIVEDLDGDEIELGTTDSSKQARLLSDNSKTLQVVTYYYEKAYDLFWYPIMLMAILFLFYPFVWNGDRNAKKR